MEGGESERRGYRMKDEARKDQFDAKMSNTRARNGQFPLNTIGAINLQL